MENLTSQQRSALERQGTWPDGTRLVYPPSLTVEQYDDYHGQRVHDRYRWLEDPDSPETRQWIAAQNELTLGLLQRLPGRERFRQRLTELWNHARVGATWQRGGRYFQFRNSGLQNQNVLYALDRFDGQAEVLLDPNELSPDGTVALNNWQVSRDGRLLAYALSASGSDWQTWRVRNVATREDLPDRIEWSKFSGAAWLHDGSGFFYARYDEPTTGATYTAANLNQKLCFHRLGNTQTDDNLVLARPDHPDWRFATEVSDDGRYLIVHVRNSTARRNRIMYQDMSTGGELRDLIDNFEAGFDFVGNDGTQFYFWTNHQAPRGKLVVIDLTRPEPEQWRTLIAEGEDPLESVSFVGDTFVALYLRDAHHSLKLFDCQGNPLRDIVLPTFGSLLSIEGERADTELFYVFHSFAYPPTVFRYDFATHTSALIAESRVDFDFRQFETTQRFATSRDGTRVPMFVIQRKGIALDGRNPTLLYGYGGFNISQTPNFIVNRLPWLELGGVFVMANLRGGGEYGEEWHETGTIHRKQNVFDDFIACAEHLIAQGVTSSEHLAIQGGSNGGLLVGACLTQRSDLFGAVNVAVGVLDMLRYHLFTIGAGWATDYGRADDPEQFESLLAYSPLHRVRAGSCYPPTLITTSDHDDRVVPAHSFKFAAALQAAQSCDNPVLIRIQTSAGHGMGKPTSIIIEESADVWAFIAQALNVNLQMG